MKKTLAAGVFALFCLSASLSAFSWSGIVDNSSKFTGNSDFSAVSLTQTNDIYLSFSTGLGEGGNMKLSGEGLFKNVLAGPVTPEANLEDSVIADCDLFKFSGSWATGSGTVSLDAGRFFFSDASGSVFSQTSDGISVAYNALKLKAGLYAGYTGLLNGLNVSMLGTPAGEPAKVYSLCPAYIPVMVDFAFKALLETNTIGVQGDFFMPVDTEKNDIQ